MLILPMQTITLVEALMVELASNCEKVPSVLCGKKWKLSEQAREAIETILSLDCVCGSHSVSSIADAVSDYNLDFDSDLKLS